MNWTFFLILIFSFSTISAQNLTSETEAGSEHCSAGNCNAESPRSENLSKIPTPKGLGVGVQRVITNLYGLCDAAKPLNSIKRLEGRTGHFICHVVSEDPGVKLPWGVVYVEGYSSDTLRAVDTNLNPLGVYAGVATGSKACTNTVDVNGEKINPAKVHKIFGDSAAGRRINSEFNVFSCGSSKYLNNLDRVATAFNCGLLKINNGTPPGIALDSAGFIGASAMAACIKLHPEQNLTGDGIKFERKELYTGVLKENLCLKNPKITPGESPILSGDIFVIGTHSIVITDVGSDPFGITRAQGNCNSINADDFNFAFGQSTSVKAIGPINSTALAYSNLRQSSGYDVNAAPLDALVAMARSICGAKKNGEGSRKSSEFFPNSTNRHLRHNSGEPRCRYEPEQCPKSTGSECAEACGL